MKEIEKRKKLAQFVKRFKEAKIFVLGDLMVDRYIYGKVSRISPEAPVPVVDVNKETIVPGGAGNVANNIASLGGKVFLSSVVGEDSSGEKLVKDLTSYGINGKGIFSDFSRPTTLKVRIIAEHQQVVRCDWEDKVKINPLLNEKIFVYLKSIIRPIDAIVISDYGKGVITPFLLKRVISLAQRYSKPIIVDPKVEHFLHYQRVTCITPNLAEAMAGIHWHYLSSERDIERLGEIILRKLNCLSVLITRGEKGMTLFEGRGKRKLQITYIPTAAKEVYDVTGAGDTVVSVLSLGLAVGLSIREAAYLANYAAGIVVGKLGTATVSPEELEEVISGG